RTIYFAGSTMKTQSVRPSAARFRQLAEHAQTEDQFRRLATALQSAREEERTALARELHDELGQTLTSLKLELARLAKELIAIGMPLQMIDRLQSIVGTSSSRPRPFGTSRPSSGLRRSIISGLWRPSSLKRQPC